MPPPPPKPLVAGQDLSFQFGKMEEIPKVVWKALASANFSAATGNANVISISGGAFVSRNDGKNRVLLSADGLYGFTKNRVQNDTNMNGMADPGDVDNGVGEERKTTAALFLSRLRYDRFFTPNNSGYVAVYAGFDLPASIQVKTGVQAGYARQILKSRMHELSAELGYDFTFDRLLVPGTMIMPEATTQDVYLHSGRLFLGYLLSVSEHTAVRASAEALINFNGVHIGDRDVGAGQATRFNGKLEVTTRVWQPISFRAAFNLRYNNAPALNAAPGITYSPDNPSRYNQTLDTLTELGLVVNFI